MEKLSDHRFEKRLKKVAKIINSDRFYFYYEGDSLSFYDEYIKMWFSCDHLFFDVFRVYKVNYNSFIWLLWIIIHTSLSAVKNTVIKMV